MTSLPPGMYAPPYGAPPGYPPPHRPTNTLAIVALVCAFVFAPLGIVFGHLSLSQIKKTGEDGRGLAIGGLVVGYMLTAITVVVIALSVLFVVTLGRALEDFDQGRQSPWPDPQQAPASLPAFDPPPTLGTNCQYPATTEPAAKPVKPPRAGRVPTDPAVVTASMTTTVGNIGIELNNRQAPCTVNNFASLAAQGYFDDTTCHRLDTANEHALLYCGDPTGDGDGGPGYRFPNEYPTNQFRLTDPALQTPVLYPRGTLAMANVGPGTNGSQFFIVIEDAPLPPKFTVFGTVDPTGLQTLQKVAQAGVAGSGDDGRPSLTVTIESVRLD